MLHHEAEMTEWNDGFVLIHLSKKKKKTYHIKNHDKRLNNYNIMIYITTSFILYILYIPTLPSYFSQIDVSRSKWEAINQAAHLSAH